MCLNKNDVDSLIKTGLRITKTQDNFSDIDLNIDCYYVINEKEAIFKLKYPTIYESIKNKCFFLKPNKIVVKSTNTTMEYIDNYGNYVKTETPGTLVEINGEGNHIIIGDAKGSINIITTDNCTINIGDNYKCNYCTINSKRNSTLIIGKNNSLFGNSTINLYEDSSISIGNNNEIGEELRITALYKGTVTIGNDCLFSRNSRLLTNDGHAIFDIRENKRINPPDSNKNRIELMNHIWLGLDVVVLGPTKLSSGTIVGSRSIVKGSYPNNCIIAGSLAKVIKKDIAWSNSNYTNDINDIYPEYRLYSGNEDYE